MEIAIDTIGAHPATELCITALQRLHEGHDFKNVLDMGCGNGILSVVAATVWEAQVLAVDISPKALSDAAKNIAENGLENRIKTVRSDGFIEPTISQTGPYDLVILNMLAEFVVASALQVKSGLKPGGFVVISGILDWKAADTELTYRNLGFEIIEKFSNSPWQSLIFRLPEKT